MQKTDLIEVIKKYYLGGLNNVMKYRIKDTNLVAQANPTGVFSYVEANVAGMEDAEFGVYYTDKLLSLLNVLDNEIGVGYDFKKNKITALNIKDKSMEASYMLADLTAVDEFYRAGNENKILEFERVPLPEFSVEVAIKKDWTDVLLKAKRALSDAKMVALELKGETLEFVVNYSKSQSSRIVFQVPATVETPLDLQVHNIDLFVVILTANQDYKSATLKISDIGVVLFEFTSDSYVSKYLVKALDV